MKNISITCFDVFILHSLKAKSGIGCGGTTYPCYVRKELNIGIHLLGHFSLVQIHYVWFSMIQETCLLMIISIHYQNIVSDVNTNILLLMITFYYQNIVM